MQGTKCLEFSEPLTQAKLLWQLPQIPPAHPTQCCPPKPQVSRAQDQACHHLCIVKITKPAVVPPSPSPWAPRGGFSLTSQRSPYQEPNPSFQRCPEAAQPTLPAAGAPTSLCSLQILHSHRGLFWPGEASIPHLVQTFYKREDTCL